jgi:hypothetical protein
MNKPGLVMQTINARVTLDAVAGSLRDVHSLMDFLAAVRVGAETASGMLSDMELPVGRAGHQ